MEWIKLNLDTIILFGFLEASYNLLIHSFFF